MAGTSDRRRWVVAHFMVGNTYPYAVKDWLEDLQLASSNELDGFALNVGREDWQSDRVNDCYDAALQSGLPFKLFISLDMTYVLRREFGWNTRQCVPVGVTSIPAEKPEDVERIRDYVSRYAHHPNQLRLDGKVVVSTFAGENSLFGQPSLEHAWKYVKSALERTAPVHLIPSFFIDPRRYPSLSCMDGYFNWNGSWPLHLTPDSPRRDIECPKLETDRHHLHHLGERTFMAAVSPWFFTHYGPQSWNKNWIYRGDDWLFVRRWEQLISMRQDIDIVQVISWNDYGESHYIGPIKGAQPNSQAWVDGFPHEAWLHLNAYYARAFKGGHYTAISEDTIYVWGRPHLKEAHAPDEVPRPKNWQLTDDTFWVVIFASAPAVITLSAGLSDRHLRSIQVSAGVTKLSHPMIPGGSMKIAMHRAGMLIAEYDAAQDGFHFQAEPRVYNFNAFVAKSHRSPQAPA